MKYPEIEVIILSDKKACFDWWSFYLNHPDYGIKHETSGVPSRYDGNSWWFCIYYNGQLVRYGEK